MTGQIECLDRGYALARGRRNSDEGQHERSAHLDLTRRVGAQAPPRPIPRADERTRVVGAIRDLADPGGADHDVRASPTGANDSLRQVARKRGDPCTARYRNVQQPC
jgi:hypothetical protein